MGLSCMHWAVLNWEDVNILRSSLKHLLGNFCNWVWGGDGHSMVRLSLLSLPATAKECETAWCWPQLTPVLLSHLSTGPHTAYAHLFTSLPFYLETWSLNVLRVEIQSINVLIIDHDLHHAGCSVTPNLMWPWWNVEISNFPRQLGWPYFEKGLTKLDVPRGEADEAINPIDWGKQLARCLLSTIVS